MEYSETLDIYECKHRRTDVILPLEHFFSPWPSYVTITPPPSLSPSLLPAQEQKDIRAMWMGKKNHSTLYSGHHRALVSQSLWQAERRAVFTHSLQSCEALWTLFSRCVVDSWEDTGAALSLITGYLSPKVRETEQTEAWRRCVKAWRMDFLRLRNIFSPIEIVFPRLNFTFKPEEGNKTSVWLRAAQSLSLTVLIPTLTSL